MRAGAGREKGAIGLNSINDIWAHVLEALGRELSSTALNTWFSDCAPRELTDSRLIITTPEEFKKGIITSRFSEKISACLSDLFSADLGLISYDMDSDEVFIGRDFGHTRIYSENVAAQIDEEVKKIIDHCYETARGIISEHMDVLHASARLLLEKERITGEEFEALFAQEGEYQEPQEAEEYEQNEI